MKKKWVAFCSQTGSEVLNIAQAINYFPDLLVTNNSLSNLNSNLVNFYHYNEDKTLLCFDIKINKEAYNNILDNYRNAIITLNGWLKIIPEDICNQYTIYNGHPGLIDIYPELKGKDPVQRLWAEKEKYDKIGSVIHYVTPGVDEGKVIMSESAEFNFDTFEELDRVQRSISLNLWIKFLKKYIK